MKDRFLRWFFDPVDFEVNHEDGSGWGFTYNRAMLAVVGVVGAAIILCIMLMVTR